MSAPNGLTSVKVVKLLLDNNIIVRGLTLYKIISDKIWMKYPSQPWVPFGALSEFLDEVEAFENVLYYNVFTGDSDDL